MQIDDRAERILLVTRDAGVAAEVTANLQTHACGSELTRAATPDQVVDAVARGAADLVILHITSSTDSALRQLEHLGERAPAVPVVAIVPDDSLVAVAKLAGAADCIARDRIAGDELWCTVRYQLERRTLDSHHADADALLRQQDALLREGERVGNFGTWTWCLSDAGPSWSEGMHAILGVERADAPLGIDDFLELVHPDDRERVRASVSRLQEQSGGWEVHFRIVRPDGAVRSLQARTSMNQPAAAGTPAYLVGTVQDVTDQEEALAALRLSEERFRTAIDHSPMGIALLSVDGRFLKVNEAFCGLTGYTADELSRMSFRDVTHPDDFGRDLAEMKRLMAGEIDRYELEKRYIHKHGHVTWVMLTRAVVRDRQGKPLYSVSLIQDITERRRVQDTTIFLRESAQVLASSLDREEVVRILARLAVPRIADICAVDVMNEAGEIQRVATVAADPEKEQLLRSMSSGFPSSGAPPENPIARAVLTGQPLLIATIDALFLERTAYDERHLDLLRALRPKSGMVLPLIARNRIIGVISFYVSESGRRYSRTDLELAGDLANSAALAMDNARLYAQARRAAQTRDDALGFIAHDLRDPIASIMLWASKLKGDRQLDAEHQKALDAILRSSSMMKGLIGELVDVVRIEAGRLEVSVEPVPPAALLATAKDLEEAIALDKGVRLEVAEVNLPRVQADPQRIQQVLSNLIGNAVKFTTRGGVIALKAAVAGDQVVFSVTDSGVGIPAASLPNVFDRFWQAAHARKAGVGLGLAIVKGIVEAHGGRVWAESRMGHGTTFSFTLPLWRGSLPDVAPSTPLPEQPKRRAKVLVVDDYALTRTGLVQILQSHPEFEVVGEASNGEEALAAAERTAPDLVLMDIAMPQLDGLAATRALMAREPSTRVLLLTGSASDSGPQEALRAGARGYIRKTASADRLITALQTVARGETIVDDDGRRLAVAPDASGGKMRAALALLSERERKVMAMAAQGFTAVQSGEKLFLSPKTVETYRSRAMRKLGLDTRADLIAFALRSGLIGGDPAQG